jgi:ketosteroid isomerase-like protein
MSQENVEIVRRCGEAFDRGDYQAALEALDPEIAYDLSHFPEGRVYHGHRGCGNRSGSGSERGRTTTKSEWRSSTQRIRSSWSGESEGAEREAV